MEDKLLIKRAKKGDKEALLSLVMNQKADYYKLAYSYMKNKDDSLDAMQDMIVILYQKIYTLKNNEAFYSWSKTILVNCCKKILRDYKKLVPIDNIKEASYEMDESFERNLVLDEYLAKLNPIHEEVIRLKYIVDLDYNSIANLLEIPLGTVKSRIHTAMTILKNSMKGDHLND
ncbi:MAG TPA: sigma-70 family RNA polymerase sigma factor [Epulopiscium sp.]|nr:sigma-70 family RNA polymerase sigma factor [Candidatus Epulonipiscium sp.]